MSHLCAVVHGELDTGRAADLPDDDDESAMTNPGFIVKPAQSVPDDWLWAV